MPNSYSDYLQDYSEYDLDSLIYEFKYLEHLGGKEAELKQEAIMEAAKRLERKEKIANAIKNL
jgi:hypothetical protein